jgi:hypothetical protein
MKVHVGSLMSTYVASVCVFPFVCFGEALRVGDTLGVPSREDFLAPYCSFRQ